METNKAFLELANGEWLDDFVYISKEPLKRMGFEIIEFEGHEAYETFSKYFMDIEKDVIIGSVESTIEFFKACSIETPKYLGYPKELKQYLNRDIRKIRFRKLTDEYFPCFIKPSDNVKEFTGLVIEGVETIKFLQEFYGISGNTNIYVSDVIDIQSEYRCFVHEEKLMGVKHYSGDFKLFPNIHTIEVMISKYKSSNVAYTLDVGISKTGRTILIEVNDMWAIGSYGMSGEDYALMCVRRMREIGRQANGEEKPLWKVLRDRYNN